MVLYILIYVASRDIIVDLDRGYAGSSLTRLYTAPDHELHIGAEF